MVAENVDVVRQIYLGLGRGDFGLVDRYFDPAAEVYQTGLLPWAGRYYRGHRGVTDFLMTIIATVDPIGEARQLVGAGNHVVETGRSRDLVGRGGLDAAEVQIWKLRDRKVVSLQRFVDIPPAPFMSGGQG